MSDSIQYVEYQATKKKKSEAPVTQDWNGARMIRVQSVIISAKEILNMSKTMDVVKVNIIGTPSTGKTTLAMTLAHLCHKMAAIPYVVKIFEKNDLVNFKDTLSKLQPLNHILIFDDVSFINANTGARQIKQIEQAFTEIRHLPGGQDVKIIAIFNFHYNMAMSKYLRQSDFFYWTSIGSSELENTQHIVGTKFTQRIFDFRRVYQEAVTTEKFSFLLDTKGKKFIYEFRNPFAPVFFFNNRAPRTIMFPTRQWIDKTCTICANSSTAPIKGDGDIKKLDEERKTLFKDQTWTLAVKIKLFQMGFPVFPPRVKKAMMFIDDKLKRNDYNVEDIANFYNLKNTRILRVKEPQKEDSL